jgi:uncharacterized damage-inducible protein DinB
MARWAHTYYDESLAFRRSVDDLRRPVHLPWQDRILEITGGVPHDATLGDTMLQVALHSTYHRGQVNLRLRQLGSETPMTDFIAWVWLGKPKAQWTV